MPLSLAEMFDRVPDPRQLKGKIHDLTPFSTSPSSRCSPGEPPSRASHNSVEILDPTSLSRSHSVAEKHPALPLSPVSFDDSTSTNSRRSSAIGSSNAAPISASISHSGKSLRGSHDGDTPAVHLVALFAPKVQAVVGQLRVDAKTNEHKAALKARRPRNFGFG